MRVAGQLPRHLYVWIDTRFTHGPGPNGEYRGFIPALWFGLVSIPARMWGCTVLLESGAVYRNLPPHAIAFSEKSPQNTAHQIWTPRDAQYWDCYGTDFEPIEYEALKTCTIKAIANSQEMFGRYLFTVMPIGDGYSNAPDQSKEFTFVALENNRLTIQPTNRVLCIDKSFTRNENAVFPTDLKRQTEVYSCER